MIPISSRLHDRYPDAGSTRDGGIPRWLDSLWLVPAALLLSLLCSCASGMGTPPRGGPPDSTAPAVLGSVPANGSVNFADESISVEFSEYVEEGRVSEQVVITPIPAVPPEFGWSGRTLEITFKEPLVKDRTYAVTFGSGIVDLSGNRLGTPFTLRFSTGNEIDSGRIQGRVLGKAKGEAYIYAYLIPPGNTRFSDTLRPDSTRPDFIAPIGDDGGFSLEGLPNGRFRLFAVVDEFNDQLFSPGQDAYGVSTSDVDVTSPVVPVTGVMIRLRTAPDDLIPPDIYGATAITRTRTEIRFSEPIDSSSIVRENVTLTSADGAVPITGIWRSPANPLAVMISHPALGVSTEARIALANIRDTSGNLLPDSSATVVFTPANERDSLPPTLLPPGVDSVHAYTFPDSIRIAFDEPIVIEDVDGAVSLRDTAGPRAQFRLYRVSPAEFVARPLDTLYGAARGVLEINLARFGDAEGTIRDSVVRINVAIGQPRQNGTLEGTITDSVAPGAAHVVIARSVESGAVHRLTGLRSGPWKFDALPEGEYEISAFRDTDGDGIYDYGSVAPYRPAELYLLWSGNIRVRPRWATNQVGLVFR